MWCFGLFFRLLNFDLFLLLSHLHFLYALQQHCVNNFITNINALVLPVPFCSMIFIVFFTRSSLSVNAAVLCCFRFQHSMLLSTYNLYGRYTPWLPIHIFYLTCNAFHSSDLLTCAGVGVYVFLSRRKLLLRHTEHINKRLTSI